VEPSGTRHTSKIDGDGHPVDLHLLYSSSASSNHATRWHPAESATPTSTAAMASSEKGGGKAGMTPSDLALPRSKDDLGRRHWRYTRIKFAFRPNHRLRPSSPPLVMASLREGLRHHLDQGRRLGRYMSMSRPISAPADPSTISSVYHHHTTLGGLAGHFPSEGRRQR
jgi:hypothetical protein